MLEEFKDINYSREGKKKLVEILGKQKQTKKVRKQKTYNHGTLML